MSQPSSDTLHARYDRDERSLLESASNELWASDLLDEVIDIASPIMAGSAWDGLPADAPPRTAERRTASSALLAMGLRACRTVAIVVRAGYAPEALAGLRRVAEIAGHAQLVADDETGHYAVNWMSGRGRAAKPRVAFGDPGVDALWKRLSGHAHAAFDAYAQHSTTLQGKRVVHSISPKRDQLWDDITLWLTARHMIRVLAAVLKVHPEVEQTGFLAVATRVVEAEDHLAVRLERGTQSS